MSDCKTMYRKVKEFVKYLYPDQLNGNLARNMNTLTSMITGIIIGKETQLPQIETNVPETIKQPSTEKRFKRLIINEKVTEHAYFLPFVKSVLSTLGPQEMICAIDGSLVGRGCICLMISLIYKHRALPIAFTIFKGKKGYLPKDAHVELVKKLQPLIPESTRQVIFLGDGEFDGTALKRTLNHFGWKYAFRTPYNITLYIGGEPFQIDILATMLPKGCYERLPDCKITHKQYGPITAVAWWGDDQKERLFLVTNFLSGSKACDYYSNRFTIETFFSDQKSRGFNIDKSHLSCPQRLTRMMHASCLAYFLFKT